MRILLLSTIIILTACTSEPEIPENVLKKEKMSAILVDIHLLEAKVQHLNLSADSSNQVYDILQKELYQKHDVDSLTYSRSMEFYAEHPEMFHEIYEIVVDTLMIRERSKKID